MEKQKIETVLRMITDAMVDLEQAKEDYKYKISAAFEAYEFTPQQVKALLQVAKAKLTEGKLQDLETATEELGSMIELVKEF